MGVTQDVVGSKSKNQPAGRTERVEAGYVAAELRPLTMMVAFVLDGDPPLRIGEIDPAEKCPTIVANLVLRRQWRRAGIDQQQPESRFHRRLGQRLREEDEVPHLTGSGAGDPIGGVRGQLSGCDEAPMTQGVHSCERVRTAQASAEVKGCAYRRGHRDAGELGDIGRTD